MRKGSRNEERYAKREAKSYQKKLNKVAENVAVANIQKQIGEANYQAHSTGKTRFSKWVAGRDKKHIRECESEIAKGKKEIERLLNEASNKGYSIDSKETRQHYQYGIYDASIERPEFSVSKSKDRPKDVTFEVDSSGQTKAKSEKITAAGQELAKKSQDISNQFDDLTKEYDKEFKSLKNNKEFINSMAEQVKKEWGIDQIKGSNGFDPEFLSLAVEQVLDDSIDKFYSNDLKSKAKVFNDSVDDYYNSAQKMTNDLVRDFGKTSMHDAARYERAVGNSLADIGGAQWVRYLNNHQEMAYIENPVYDEIKEEIEKSLK